MRNISKELKKRLEKFTEQERLPEAIDMLLDFDEDKEKLIRMIDNGELTRSGKIIKKAVEMQLKREETH